MERDKFLTQAMGECWFEADEYPAPPYRCRNCGLDRLSHYNQEALFSTWAGFGKLWEWAQQQEWWGDFVAQLDILGIGCFKPDMKQTMLDCFRFVSPDRFANAVYEYLKQK